jgi:hypothetical protein
MLITITFFIAEDERKLKYLSSGNGLAHCDTFHTMEYYRTKQINKMDGFLFLNLTNKMWNEGKQPKMICMLSYI